jgi:AraC-like DNA-binding protein
MDLGRNKNRMTFTGSELGSRFVEIAGFDSILRPISLNHHRHQGYEVVFLAEGETCFDYHSQSVKSLRLSGGDISLVQPEITHGGIWDVIQPCTLYWIVYCLTPADGDGLTLTREIIERIDRTLHDTGNRIFAAGENLERLFLSLWPLYRRLKSDAYDELTICQLRLLHQEILLLVYKQLTGHIEVTSHADERMADVLEYMEKRLGDRLSVSEMARRYGLSRSKFHERFKRKNGLSPAEYLMRRRVEHARHLLAGPRSITDIAYELGFSSSQYFSHVFRKYTGQPPSAFRLRLSGDINV